MQFLPIANRFRFPMSFDAIRSIEKGKKLVPFALISKLKLILCTLLLMGLAPSLIASDKSASTVGDPLKVDLIQVRENEFDFLKHVKGFDSNPFERSIQIAGVIYQSDSILIFRVELPKLESPSVIQMLWSTGNTTEAFKIVDGTETRIQPKKARYFSIEVLPEDSGKHVYFVRRAYPVTVAYPTGFQLQTFEDFQENAQFEMYIVGAISGVIGIMMLYNLGMLYFFREKYLFYYLIYSLSVFVWFLSSSGLLEFPSTNDFLFSMNCIFFVAIPPMISGSILAFSVTVLNLHKRSVRSVRVAVAIFGLSFIVSFLPVIGVDLAARYMITTMPPAFIFCFALAARSAYLGYKPAYAMMIGWTGLVLSIVGLAILFVFETNLPGVGWAVPMALAFEVAAFSFSMGQKLRLSEIKILKENQHAFHEMKKMVYSHQLEKIKGGETLENTMPTETAHACVISFDIIGSSRIKHIKAKEFFRKVFARCNNLMNEGYDGSNLKSRAYRIKEMGDGFLCSVGYPFQSLSDNAANDAIDLAKGFAGILAEESKNLHYDEPITCGIGISLDTLTGFFPESGTKEYDLYGPAIVLATRYESMRKSLFDKKSDKSVLIIQDVVYRSLDPKHREGFTSYDLSGSKMTVRDDPSASRLYYQFIEEKHEGSDKIVA